MDTKKAILFLGLPGSGKTTQAARLAEEFNFLPFTTSKIIRDKFRNTPVGENSKIDVERVRYDAGEIVDPALVVEWLSEAIKANFYLADGIILDGSPRSREETISLLPILFELFGSENIRALHLVVNPETARNRISVRFICMNCERSYSKEMYIAAQTCADQSCQGPLIQKHLDKPEIFEERLRVFQKQTQGALDFFEECGSLIPIDGELDPDRVYNNMKEAIFYGHR